jgi:uncharacterized protein YggE
MREKKYIYFMGSVALVVASLLGLKAMWYLYRSAATLPVNRSIIVSAEGRATVAPDLARLSFAVISEGEDPEKLQVDNSKKMNASIDFIKAQGIDPKDIQTANYNLQPRYEYDEKKRKSFISGYTLSQTVNVRIRDFDKISPILAKLPSLGINQINGVNFEVEDPDKYLNSAREEAFKRAYEKAAAMAKQNKARLGRVVTFSEGFGGGPVPYPRFLEAAAYGKGGLDMAPPPIEPGSEEISVTVSVTYELR